MKDALGRPVSIEVTKQPQQGSDLHLTLDANIQERVEAVLSDVGQQYTPKGATALVMDPRDGSILALANWPRVNANDPGGAPAYARQDRAVTSSYEPGSTFKAFTVSGALQDGLITSNTPFYLPPTIEVADRKISDAHPRGAETLTVKGILAQSSNVGAVKIGLKLGPQNFDRWVRAVRLRPADGCGPPRRVARHRAAPEPVLGLLDRQPADRPGRGGHADPDGHRLLRDRERRDDGAPTHRDRGSGARSTA